MEPWRPGCQPPVGVGVHVNVGHAAPQPLIGHIAHIGPGEWLMEQLMDLGPEQARRFDDFAHAYSSLADQYGLWTAASVMERSYLTSPRSFLTFLLF